MDVEQTTTVLLAAGGTSLFEGERAVVILLLALAALLAGGALLLVALRRRDRDIRPVSDKPTAEGEELRRLRERLEAAEAARHTLAEHLAEAQAQALARRRLMEAIAEISLPSLDEMEGTAREMLRTVSAGQRLDRRSGLGQLADELRSVSIRLQDLLVLGRIDGSDGPARQQPCELRSWLRRLAADQPAIDLDLDPTLPELILCDRGLLSVAVESASRLYRDAPGAVSLLGRAEPAQADLVEIELLFEGSLEGTPLEVLTLDPEHWVEEQLLALGQQGVLFAVSHRAVERLGGRIELLGDGPPARALRLTLVVPVAIDRRRRIVTLPAAQVEAGG